MADLRTDYKDDVLDTTQNTNRVFDIKDSNGNVLYSNVSLEDVTQYLQEGDGYGAQQVNEQNQKINEINEHLTDLIVVENVVIAVPAIEVGKRVVGTADITKEGYTPLLYSALSGAFNGMYYETVGFTANDTKINVTVFNARSTASPALNVTVKVLYLKNTNA